MMRLSLLCGLVLLCCCAALPARAKTPKIFIGRKADGRVVAGTTPARDWHFFSFPSMKPLGRDSAAYFRAKGKPGLIWTNDSSVPFNTMDADSRRECGYVPCGPVSVMRRDLATGKTTAVFQGTLLCDYTVQSFAGGVAAAERILDTVCKTAQKMGMPGIRSTLPVRPRRAARLSPRMRHGGSHGQTLFFRRAACRPVARFSRFGGQPDHPV